MLTTLSSRVWHVDAYRAALSDNLCLEALDKATPVLGVKNLVEVKIAQSDKVQVSSEELNFLCNLYDQVWPELAEALEQRRKDQAFVDQRVDAVRPAQVVLQLRAPGWQRRLNVGNPPPAPDRQQIKAHLLIYCCSARCAPSWSVAVAAACVLLACRRGARSQPGVQPLVGSAGA